LIYDFSRHASGLGNICYSGEGIGQILQQHEHSILGEKSKWNTFNLFNFVFFCLKKGLIILIYSFYNSMWLVANDIIIGLTIGSFLVNNSEYVANIILRDYLDVRNVLIKFNSSFLI
jgi:hypothetical protein